MSIFAGAMRPHPSLTHEAVQSQLATLQAHLEPDPLFRRRMRGEALNRFVAAREGSGIVVRDREMRRTTGTLGRACLYASLTLSVSAASVLAASQGALPGETLYGLKLRIEQVRMEMLPGHLHEQLVANALTERVDEMTRLADAGNLDQAILMAPQIEAGLEQLIAVQESTDGVTAVDGIEHQLLVLDALIERLPESARIAVEKAIDERPGRHLGQGVSAPAGGSGPANQAGAANRAGAADQADPEVVGGGDAAPGDAASPGEAVATPEFSSWPQHPATPEPAASPHPSAEGTPSAEEGVGPQPRGGPPR